MPDCFQACRQERILLRTRRHIKPGFARNHQNRRKIGGKISQRSIFINQRVVRPVVASQIRFDVKMRRHLPADQQEPCNLSVMQSVRCKKLRVHDRDCRKICTCRHPADKNPVPVDAVFLRMFKAPCNGTRGVLDLRRSLCRRQCGGRAQAPLILILKQRGTQTNTRVPSVCIV